MAIQGAGESKQSLFDRIKELTGIDKSKGAEKSKEVNENQETGLLKRGDSSQRKSPEKASAEYNAAIEDSLKGKGLSGADIKLLMDSDISTEELLSSDKSQLKSKISSLKNNSGTTNAKSKDEQNSQDKDIQKTVSKSRGQMSNEDQMTYDEQTEAMMRAAEMRSQSAESAAEGVDTEGGEKEVKADNLPEINMEDQNQQQDQQQMEQPVFYTPPTADEVKSMSPEERQKLKEDTLTQQAFFQEQAGLMDQSFSNTDTAIEQTADVLKPAADQVNAANEEINTKTEESQEVEEQKEVANSDVTKKTNDAEDKKSALDEADELVQNLDQAVNAMSATVKAMFATARALKSNHFTHSAGVALEAKAKALEAELKVLQGQLKMAKAALKIAKGDFNMAELAKTAALETLAQVDENFAKIKQDIDKAKATYDKTMNIYNSAKALVQGGFDNALMGVAATLTAIDQVNSGQEPTTLTNSEQSGQGQSAGGFMQSFGQNMASAFEKSAGLTGEEDQNGGQNQESRSSGSTFGDAMAIGKDLTGALGDLGIGGKTMKKANQAFSMGNAVDTLGDKNANNSQKLGAAIDLTSGGTQKTLKGVNALNDYQLRQQAKQILKQQGQPITEKNITKVVNQLKQQNKDGSMGASGNMSTGKTQP